MAIKLTEKQEADIHGALRSVYDLQQDIEKLRNCGTNCDAEYVRLANLRQQLEELRKQFGKGI